jgi:hypothetical protein|tara:strand:- start:170 stop:427 length:258 start_codon:yes stop_codon:yes gene_type:complete
MVTFTYPSKDVLQSPEIVLQKFSMDLTLEREKTLEKLKGKKIQIISRNDIINGYFRDSDLTHFTYRTINEGKIKKTLLKNLILNN